MQCRESRTYKIPLASVLVSMGGWQAYPIGPAVPISSRQGETSTNKEARGAKLVQSLDVEVRCVGRNEKDEENSKSQSRSRPKGNNHLAGATTTSGRNARG